MVQQGEQPGRVQRLWNLDFAAADTAAQPIEESGDQVAVDVLGEGLKTGLDASGQVLQKADGMGDDVADDLAYAGDDRPEERGQLGNRFAHTDDKIDPVQRTETLSNDKQ